MFFCTSEWFGGAVEIELKSCSPNEIYVGLIYGRKFSWIMYLLMDGILQERMMHWASAIKDQEKQPFLASKCWDQTLTGFLQTPATWHAQVTASIPALRVPSLNFQSKCVLQSGVGNTTGNIHVERFCSDCAWSQMFIEVREIRCWWTFVDCTPLCLYHLVLLWHASTIQISRDDS